MSQAATPAVTPAATRVQAKLERKYGKSINQILLDELAAHRYRRNLPMLIATKLDISMYTFTTWCRQFDINLDDYRYAPEEK